MYDSAAILLGTYPRKMKRDGYKKTYTRMFMEPGVGRRGKGELFNGCRVSGLQNEKVLEI